MFFVVGVSDSIVKGYAEDLQVRPLLETINLQSSTLNAEAPSSLPK